MVDCETETLTLSVTSETAMRLRALTVARNGSIHNVADSVIRAGIVAELARSPARLAERYEAIRAQQGPT